MLDSQKKQYEQFTVGFVSLGCPKNTVDSEKMLAQIATSGQILTQDVENADLVVINTCAFIEPAVNEAIETIKYFANLKQNKAIQKIIVTGCLVQRLGKDLLKQIPQIDAVVAIPYRDSIDQAINDVLNTEKPLTYLDQQNNKIADDSARLLITGPAWAYLRISQGCDRRCSFCTIPAIRGRFRSKPVPNILEEAQQLADSGIAELNIIAQDSNYYLKDKQKKDGLIKLLEKIEKIEKIQWIRLMYLYPAGIDDKLIDFIANSKKVLNYIDMPIQHINNSILKAMKRSDTAENTANLVEKLRKKIPDIALRTTVIAGFPGETPRIFDQLLDFIKWAKFDALGCFPYYPEKGTPAAELPNQIDLKTKQQRTDEIMRTQQQIAFEKNKKRIGTIITCLVEQKTAPNKGLGRFYAQAPQIDSICSIKKLKAKPGQFINAKVTSTNDYDLNTKQV